MTLKQFRISMTDLHNWLGIIICAVLFAIFWMGTLSVFDKEFDRWMQPETRQVYQGDTVDIERLLMRLAQDKPTDQLTSLSLYLPDQRTPVVQAYVSYQNAGYIHQRLSPANGDLLGPPKSHAGTGFFFPFHFMLMLPGFIGYWLVGFAALSMLILLVSGIVIHRKIISDFFIFRPRKDMRRSSLDLHNVTGVIFLPFHFLIAFSGLVIFAGWYSSLPWIYANDLSDDRTVELYWKADEYGQYSREKSDQPANMANISHMVKQAEQIWSARYGEAAISDNVRVNHYGDQNAYVGVYRSYPSTRVDMGRDRVFFDGVTGDILVDYTGSPVVKVRTWLQGFHFIQFQHWPLRWLYFIAGLAGCVMIVTGFIFWLASRRKKGAIKHPFNTRVVEALGVGSVTGLLLATAGFLVANRMLPEAADVFGHSRSSVEVWVFFSLWLLSFVHAAGRGSLAWQEQTLIISTLCVVAVIANWATTTTNLLSVLESRYWPVAAIDIGLLVVAGLGALFVRHMRSKQAPINTSRTRAGEQLATRNPQ